MWNNFDGKPYSRQQFVAHLDLMPPGRLNWCRFITVHNTAGPTIKQWCSSVCTPAQRIINLESYYEHSLGWHAGPHGFIPPSKDVCLYGFTNLDVPGVHASCFNSMSIGLEMVGDFDAEDFNSGLGALVRDNAIFVLAQLHRKRGLRPDGFKLGVSGLHFHVDCKRDNHACPGKTVNRDALVKAVLDEMERQSTAVSIATAPLPEDSMSIDGAAVGAVAATVPASVAPVVSLLAPSDPVPNAGGAAQIVTEDKPGFFDRLSPNAAKVNDLADQGSRLAQSLKQFKGWFWKGTTLAVGGSGAASQFVPQETQGTLSHLAGQHPFLLAFACMLIVAALAYVGVKLAIEKGFLSAYADGRYFPRGAEPQKAG